jgi:hypothetical protein
MPSDSGNNTFATIIVAIITTAGVITAAYLGTHHSSHQGNKPPVQTPVDPPNDQPHDQPHALQPVMGALQVNVGLMGGTDYDSVHLSSAADCSERCRNENKCVAMTFTADGTCWLKYQVTEAVPTQGMISAIKTHQ